MLKRIPVNRRRDHRAFSRCARKTNKLNIPGQIVQRGGVRL